MNYVRKSGPLIFITQVARWRSYHSRKFLHRTPTHACTFVHHKSLDLGYLALLSALI